MKLECGDKNYRTGALTSTTAKKPIISPGNTEFSNILNMQCNQPLRVVLSNQIVTNHMWLFKLKLIKQN